MKKRILSCFMALALCLTLLPTAALADEPANGETKQEQENQQENQQEQPTEEKTPSPALLGTPASAAAQAADGMNHESHTSATKLYMEKGEDGTSTLKRGNSDWEIDAASGYLMLEAGEYYLSTDLTLTTSICIRGANVTLCLNGKTIKYTGTNSYAILVDRDNSTKNPGHLTLTDCSGNNAGTIKGGSSEVVELQANSNLDMYGGTITGSSIGVDFTSENTVFNMHDGVITGNSGYGVYMTAGTFKMYGGFISNNPGRGVSVGAISKFNMSGGEITGNKGGVEVYEYGSASLTVSGAAKIKDNMVNGKPNNVYLPKGKSFTAENLTEGAEIGVTTAEPPTRSASIKVAGVVQDFSDYIKSDQTGYTLQHDNNQGYMVLAIQEHKHYLCGKTDCNQPGSHPSDDKLTDFIPWTDAEARSQNGNGKTASDSLPKAEGKYYLTGNVTLSETWTPKNNITLDLNGKTITANGNITAIYVIDGVTFTLCDCKGGKDAYGQITHTAGKTGSGVYVRGTGRFYMYGGSITGNTENNGGGVYMAGGQFTMYGGSITKNTAKKDRKDAGGNGGGVYVSRGCKFDMNGNASVSDNTATNNGGGVYASAGTFEMNDTASVSGNKATGNGGGVSVSTGGTFTMNGYASVKNNETANDTWGGGVYVSDKKSTFTMNGNASITDNTANQGGGVYASAGAFTMTGNASITRNTVNGVFVSDGVSFTVSGAPTVKENTGKNGASNVYLTGGIDTTITIGGALDEGASIGVTKGAGSADSVIATGANKDYSGKFFVDDGTYVVKHDTTNNKLVLATKSGGTTTPTTPTGHTHYLCGGKTACNKVGGHTCASVTFKEIKTLDALKAAAATGGNYYLSESITLDKTLEIKGNLTLCLNGQTITGAVANGNAIKVTDGTFTLTDCDASKRGGLTFTSEGKMASNGVYLGTGSVAFVLYGGKLVGAQDGVWLHSEDAVFTMYGGEISGCNNYGVHVVAGRFAMYGGEIINNTGSGANTAESGGVYMHDTMIVGGNAVIQSNKNKSGNDQNIYWYSYNNNNQPVPITVKEDFTGSFGVTAFNWPSPGEQMQLTSGGGTIPDIINKITSDKDIYVVEVNGSDLVLKVKDTGGETPPPVRVSKITLNTTTATLEVGKTTTLTATVTPENANNPTLTWTSSAPTIARVENGKVTALAVGTATITVKATDGSNVSANCTVTVTAAVTPSQPGGGTTPSQPSNPGGSTGGNTGGSGGSSGGSSGGGGSSSDRDSYDSNPIIKTETKNNTDGSTTKTETRRDGSVTQTTTGKDGSTSKTETKKDGSSVTENKAADGSTGTVKTDKNGQTEAKTALSNKAIEDAKRNGEPVTAPVEVEATRNSDTAPTVKIELPKNSGDTKVEIPVSNVKPGTVAVLVHPDGTEEILKDSIPTEDGIQLTVDGSATVKIVDNSKGFIDTRNHWAEDAIDFVSARGLVNGMSDTIYAPNNSTTRAQLWTILARQNDADLNGGSVWYENAQNWAKDKGISDGANPNDTINRAQMVTMLWRAVGQPTAGGTASFIDVPADAYYAGAVSWAVENGITTGVGGGRFNPTGACTRAQIATFLARSMK